VNVTEPSWPTDPPGGKTSVLQWGRERVRAGAWRGNATIAYVHPVPGSPLPSSEFVRRCLRTLARQGYARVVTGALAPFEQVAFRAAGFEPSEHLHLLSHDLRSLPPAPPSAELGITLRRATRNDRGEVLTVDGLAFDSFWRLDDAGLDEAISATPHSRFRVAMVGDRLTGYAITGRAGRRGYLQRLAVHPSAQRRGVGTVLVVDALRWLRRWRAERAMVNTQLGNDRALALYERVGFHRESSGLAVLAADLA
jgi:ribosomal protein S18 acetylase RimI-like enzyme